jgi:hypothetical protein
LHEFWHVAVVRPFIGGEATHRCDQVFGAGVAQEGRVRGVGSADSSQTPLNTRGVRMPDRPSPFCARERRSRTLSACEASSRILSTDGPSMVRFCNTLYFFSPATVQCRFSVLMSPAHNAWSPVHEHRSIGTGSASTVWGRFRIESVGDRTKNEVVRLACRAYSLGWHRLRWHWTFVTIGLVRTPERYSRLRSIRVCEGISEIIPVIFISVTRPDHS